MKLLRVILLFTMTTNIYAYEKLRNGFYCYEEDYSQFGGKISKEVCLIESNREIDFRAGICEKSSEGDSYEIYESIMGDDQFLEYTIKEAQDYDDSYNVDSTFIFYTKKENGSDVPNGIEKPEFKMRISPTKRSSGKRDYTLYVFNRSYLNNGGWGLHILDCEPAEISINYKEY